MAARIHVLLPALALLLAGCTSADSHDAHGPPALLLGIANELTGQANATWSLAAPNGTVLWESQATIEPTKTHEKKFEFEGSGMHTVSVAWEGGNGTVVYDPSVCDALMHIVVTIAPEGLSETKRECH